MEVVALIFMSIFSQVGLYNMEFNYRVIIYLGTKIMMYILQYIWY